MSSEVDIHRHFFPSWEEYPRIHFFKRRFTDVLTRYNGLLGVLPKSFVDTKIAIQLDQIKNEFERGVVVNVIGKDIDSSELTFSGVGDQETQNTHVDVGVIVYVYHISIRELELTQTQNILQFLTAASQKCDIKPRDRDIILIHVVCEVEGSYSKSKENKYVLEIHQALQENFTKLKIQQDNILLGSDHTSLKKKISDEIERQIITGFIKITSDLQRFDLVEENSNQMNILETTDIKNAVNEYLRSPGIFREITDIGDTEKAKEDFVELVVAKLCRIMKCTAVDLLAKKYCLKLAVCNELVHEVNFEEALAASFTKNTRHYLSKIKDTERETGICFNNDYMWYKIQQDLKPVFEKTEEKFVQMRRFSAVVRRLLFEIEGYFKQSIVPIQTRPEPAKLTAELRENILSIKGVYGIGTVYGRLEIHIEEEQSQSTAMVNVETEDTTSERANKKLEEDMSDQKCEQKVQNAESKVDLDSDKRPTPVCDSTKVAMAVSDDQTVTEKEKNDLKQKIAFVMKNHNFHYPYTVRYVLKKPVCMNGCFEPGDTLVGRSGKSGTLGALLKSKDLYGVTCAHVVAGCRHIFVEKEGKNPFSACSSIVKTGEDQCRLIDIAVLKLLPCFQASCEKYLENNEERVKKVDISSGPPENLVRRFVYKYGAKTGLTYGVIISVDYSIFGPNAEDYVVIVDPLAAQQRSDLPDVAGAFRSLSTTPPERNEQRSGGSDETVSIETNWTKDKDALKESSESSKIKDSLLKSQAVLTNVTEELIYERKNNHSSDRIRSAENYVQTTDVNICTEKVAFDNREDQEPLKLFVRKISEVENYVRRSVFAEKGDSGAVICSQDLSDTGSKCEAVAMLSAGDLKIEGLDGDKALSFMLKDGLRKLSDKYQLGFF